MSITFLYRLKHQKNFLILLICVGIVFVSFALSHKNQRPTKEYHLQTFDQIQWSEPKASSVYALLNPDTPDEDILFTEGTEIIGEDTEGQPTNLYNFYDKELTHDGFAQINLVGDPETSANWVASYKKGSYYVEVQYYVTPQNKNTRTSMVFSGILPN